MQLFVIYYFKIALRYDPQCDLALRDYARMLFCHGRDDEAEKYFNKAINIDEHDKITKREYNIFLLAKNDPNRNQKKLLNAAIEKDPNYFQGIEAYNKKYIL